METPGTEFDRLSIEAMKTPHREVLIRAVANVLSTSIATETHTQIVDGLPLASVARDRFHSGSICSGHPLLQQHQELCPGVAEEAQRLCSGFDIGINRLNDGLAFFSSVHQIAVWLYTRDLSRHKDDALGTWRPSEDAGRFYPATYPTTLFYHPWYHDYAHYPGGVADSVGYWAEARILGGVILFDRRDQEVVSDAEPNAIYTHPDRSKVIYRICRLLDSQKDELAAFLLSDATLPDQPCTLPILPAEANRQRVDPEQAIETTGIYRDPWERRLRPLGATDLRLRDVVDTFNYLSIQDYREARRRAERERTQREYTEIYLPSLRNEQQDV
ncbi:hypothetical protein C8A05DRAFT_48409 [Staphylotrichum tortipilum]|uniref:Uncharacterized protein n=1 Tax=Staphylotrichum tortipilum TaxID=2831512 RepID=A0AAN6RN21_9PEZI|nr:hypothetical protein C8A05DRAFT_48409 [Staphylotrichum longicolle]